jgi:ankyrin repeat protein
MPRKLTRMSSRQAELVPQRWAHPEVFNAPPGFWKQQLPGKVRKIAARGDVPALRELLQREPVALNKRGSHGRTLLWEAVRMGRLEAIQFLIEAGADANLTGCYNGESFVQLTPYCAAKYYNRGAVLEYLRPHSAPQDIFRLAYLGDDKAVLTQLDRRPELLNSEDPHDALYFMPLIAFPIVGGHAELLQTLIERGAQLAQYSAQLLGLAASSGHTDWIDLLLAGGADIRAVNFDVFLEDIAVVQHLLERGAPVNRASELNGFTPLIFLARGDKGQRLDSMQLILDYGADVNATGPMKRTALHYAAAAGDVGKIDLLLAHGANLAMMDENGDTALALANKAGRTAAAALLGAKRVSA